MPDHGFGIVGCGMIAEFHTRAINEIEGARVVAAFSRRTIEQGGFNTGADRAIVKDPKAAITVSDGLIVRVGKRKIARVKLSD